jgi:hypothetical protein
MTVVVVVVVVVLGGMFMGVAKTTAVFVVGVAFLMVVGASGGVLAAMGGCNDKDWCVVVAVMVGFRALDSFVLGWILDAY